MFPSRTLLLALLGNLWQCEVNFCHRSMDCKNSFVLAKDLDHILKDCTIQSESLQQDRL